MSRINEEQWGEFLAEFNARNAAVQPPATPQEPAMSAPGADPLAAIRQKRWLDRDGDDVNTLLALWDTRESALRALVADMQDRIDYMHRDTDWYRAQELEYWKRKVERLLSGPQP